MPRDEAADRGAASCARTLRIVPAIGMRERLGEETGPRPLVEQVRGSSCRPRISSITTRRSFAKRSSGTVEWKSCSASSASASLDVVVEDLEVDHHVLVARVGVVLAAELAGSAVERQLIEAARALEEHVLRHVREARGGAPSVREPARMAIAIAVSGPGIGSWRIVRSPCRRRRGSRRRPVTLTVVASLVAATKPA